MRNLIERVRRFIIRKIADIFFQREFTAKILIENSREGVDRGDSIIYFFCTITGQVIRVQNLQTMIRVPTMVTLNDDHRGYF